MTFGGAVAAEAATGLAFLKNGVDAHAALLGEAVTSVVSDASAAHWNPAGLAGLEKPQLFLSHVEGFADLRQEYGVITQPVGIANAALSFNGMWADDMDGYDGSANPTGSFSWSTYGMSVALGRRMNHALSLGVSAMYLRENIGSYGASGWSLGAGAQWSPWTRWPVQLGLAVRNVGPAMEFISDDVELPLTIQGGASWRYHPEGAASSFVISTDVQSVRDEETALLAGIEYGYRDLLNIGAGYRTGHDTQDFSLGIGAHPGRWSLYWAYVPRGEDLGDEHRFSLNVIL